MTKRSVLLLAVALVAVTSPGASSTVPAPSRVPAPVIGVVEAGGINVLHSDFQLAPGQSLALPPGAPKPRWVTLPTSGTFEERVEKLAHGALGELAEDTLYWIRGTRLGIYNPRGSRATTVLEDRFHATGTVSAAIGHKHGTNPRALAVFVPDTGPSAWAWLAEQTWIDVVSTSYYSLLSTGEGTHGTCPAYQEIEAFAETGRVLFSAAGNVEQTGHAFSPAGSPFSYQVGGVDESGRTYIPGPDRQGEAVTPTRPYETGDRFDFPAADADALGGSMDFGGTSGATPSTAGRAAELITYARGVLRSYRTGVRDDALAIAARGASLPSRGPLSDGRLERDELVALLHHVAIPAEQASPVRYLMEGYGALNQDAIGFAKKVLIGQEAEPERPDEDAIHTQVESLRPLLFPSGRC